MALPTQGAYRPYGGIAPERVRSTLTGLEGKAKLEGLPTGPWNVTVYARGFVPQPLRRVASGPLVVRLEKGGVVTGVVRAADGNRPVAGARVALNVGMAQPSGWPQEEMRNEARTVGQGRFRLEGVGRAAVTLVARAPGFGRAERSDLRAGVSVEVFLFPGASLAGVVRDEVGRPVEGAVVRAEGDQSWSVPPPEGSDVRGEFRMAGVQPGEYTVVAREGGRAPGIATVAVEPEDEATTSLTLSDGGYTTGRIVDAGGRPLTGRVRVEVLDERSLPTFVSDLLAADAKVDGTFALGPLPLGSLRIAVSAPRHTSRRVEVETIDGVSARMPGRTSGPTDANGLCDLASPPGAVGVLAKANRSSSRGSVTVRAGETAPLSVVLQPGLPKKA